MILNKRIFFPRIISFFLILTLILSGLLDIKITSFTSSVIAASQWTQESESDFNQGTLTNVSVIGLNEDAVLRLNSSDYNKWKNRRPTLNPGVRYHHGLASINGTDKILLFGGSHNNHVDYVADTWVYDFSNNTWTNKSPSNSPDKRDEYSISSIYGTDKVLLFGGDYDYTTIVYDDTWIYDLSDNKWTKKSISTKPEKRRDAGLAPIWGTDKIVLFGGFNPLVFDDTWVYDLSDNKWTRKYPSTKPNGRARFAMDCIWGTDKVIMFGGVSKSDTWVYDLSDNKWTEMKPITHPGNLEEHAMASIWGTDKVVIFGGKPSNQDTWIYDYSDNNWTKKIHSFKPRKISYHAMTTICGTDHIILYGGDTSITETFTWVFGPSEYIKNGTFVSDVYDTSTYSSFRTIEWNSSIVTNTSVKFQIRTANSEIELTSKQFIGPNGIGNDYYNSTPSNIWPGHYGDRWIQYKIIFNTTEPSVVPEFYNATINYNNLPLTDLKEPSYNYSSSNNTPFFKWNFTDFDSTHQTGFQVLIDDDFQFNSVNYDSGTQNLTEQYWNFPNATSYSKLDDGTWYWKVRTKDNDGDWGKYSNPFKIRIDTESPNSSVLTPFHNEFYNSLLSITGNSSDQIKGVGLKKVEVSIKRIKDNFFWSGSDWVQTKTWLLATGTTSWFYGTSSVKWDSGFGYQIQSRAFDLVDNIEIPEKYIMFTFDNEKPKSLIEFPINNTFVNELFSIYANGTDIGGSGIKKVEVCINRSIDNYYWHDSYWDSVICWIEMNKTNNWYYNTRNISWSKNVLYHIRTKATDNATNEEIPAYGNSFYFDPDKPTSTINEPRNNIYLKNLPKISGRAKDNGGSGINSIKITIYRVDDNLFWDGFKWSLKKIWLNTTGKSVWSYDSSSIPFNSGLRYGVVSKAIDNANNVELTSSGHEFNIDRISPISKIENPANNSYLNKLDMISGNSIDLDGSGLKEVRICIERIFDNRYWSGTDWTTSKYWLKVDGLEEWNFDANTVNWITDKYYSIAVSAIDYVNNIEVPIFKTIFMFDNTPPKSSIVINGNNLYTNNCNVNLTIESYDSGSGTAKMALSIDGLQWSTWEPFNQSKIFKLPSIDGIKYIYLKVHDYANNFENYVYDSIILDTTPPEELSMTNNDNNNLINSNDIRLNLDAIDTLSGVKNMSFSIDQINWTPWERFKRDVNISIPFLEGINVLFFRIDDNAGNIAIDSNIITFDSKPPSFVEILINNGNSTTDSKSVTLLLIANDETTGVFQMAFSTNSKNWSEWENFSNQKSFDLSPGDGEKIIYFKVKDEAGNIAEPVSDTILLDTTPPKSDDEEMILENVLKEKRSYFLIGLLVIIIIIILIFTFFKKKRRLVLKTNNSDNEKRVLDMYRSSLPQDTGANQIITEGGESIPANLQSTIKSQNEKTGFPQTIYHQGSILQNQQHQINDSSKYSRIQPEVTQESKSNQNNVNIIRNQNPNIFESNNIEQTSSSNFGNLEIAGYTKPVDERYKR